MVITVYNNEVKCPYREKIIDNSVQLTAEKIKKIKGLVEISVVSKSKIKKLNKVYRGKDSVTDVLSFSMQEGGSVKGPFFGEIYICYDQIVKQAGEFGESVKSEFVRMLVHGLLHISGFDHIVAKEAKKMFSIQEKLVEKIISYDKAPTK
jgi:probable rRNA maturation factor